MSSRRCDGNYMEIYVLTTMHIHFHELEALFEEKGIQSME